MESDPTEGRFAEPLGSWLQRSTWDRAVDTRRFYNENLAALPPVIRDKLCRHLRRDRSLAAHFEMVVGRFLQVLGARQIEYEVHGSEGRAVDWLARFDDGTVSVEATAPAVNPVVGETAKAAQPIIELVIRELPPGWTAIVAQVPTFGLHESKRWFRRALKDAFSVIPPAAPGASIEFQRSFPNGVLDLGLFGLDDPSEPSVFGGGPAVGYMDNTSEVVHEAIEGKRPQARGALKPVLAAIFTNGFGSLEVDKFDIAIFGRTVAHMGSDQLSFDPSGVFGSGEGEPTFAGALAFAELGMRGGPDPILYPHPRYTGRLPGAFYKLRRRELVPSGITETPATRDRLLAFLDWPTE